MFRSQFKNLQKAEQLLFEGKIDLALLNLNELEEVDFSGEENIVFNLLKSNLFYEQGDYKKSHLLAEESLKASHNFKNTLLIIRSILLKVKNNLKLKEFDVCTLLIDQVEQQKKKLDLEEKNNAMTIQHNAIILNCKGLLAQNKGNLTQAIGYSEKSLKL
ncbi:MAG: hypothetical protein ACTSQK_03615, partial [Candidatus Heimdallarchaeota archaeon]